MSGDGSQSGNWEMVNGRIHTSPPAKVQQEHDHHQNPFSRLKGLARKYGSELVSEQRFQRLWSRMGAISGEYTASVKDWMRRSGPLKVALVGAGGLVGIISLVILATFLLLFVAAAANAVLISFILSVTLVGFLMVSFFTSLTAVYVGALWAVGATISALTFCSICGMIIAAGWFTFSWGIWNVLQTSFQRVRCAVSCSASTLRSCWNKKDI